MVHDILFRILCIVCFQKINKPNFTSCWVWTKDGLMFWGESRLMILENELLIRYPKENYWLQN
jgi:hypothetical protein